MKVDESVLFELTGEKEVFNIPQKLMKMLLDEAERKRLISELEKYEHGISCSFQEFFEFFHNITIFQHLLKNQNLFLTICSQL